MKWVKKEISAELVNDISTKYGCDRLTASILARRGITEARAIRAMLEDGPWSMANPFDLPGMEAAVGRLLGLAEDEGKALVFGDRDADGVTGTALLVRALRAAGFDADWRVPAGDEPYGLTRAAVEDFARESGSLIITVDCGISCHAEIERAAELGIDVIVTDHHEPRGAPPPALALVNPKLKTEDGADRYPFPHLSGSAVAYKLARALDFAQKSALYGRRMCLLNTRPGNGGSWIIEIKKLRNLRVIDSLVEAFDPGGAAVGATRIPAFLEGQHIYVWDAAAQARNMALIFGKGVEFNFFDIAEEAARHIPATAGKSLPRLREMSRLARYEDGRPGELDVLYNLFYSLARKAEGAFADDGELLQLAALGTVADVMPLEYENRALVKRALAALGERAAAGVSDLLLKMDISPRAVGTREIAWRIAPVINAAGRLGNGAAAVELFLEEDARGRSERAEYIVALNEERKALAAAAMETAAPLAEAGLAAFGGNMAFAAAESIPRGVTGLAANRLAERFGVPAVVVSLSGGAATGSARTARGYDLQRLLDQSADLFDDCGGHRAAAGFSLDMARWEAFVERLKGIACALEFPGGGDDAETLAVDAELPLSYMRPELLDLVDRFQPCGHGNPEPRFLARGLVIAEIALLGRGESRHVKLLLDAGAYKWPAMYWNAAGKVNVEWTRGDAVDAVFTAGRDRFGGRATPTLYIGDMARSAGRAAPAG